MKQGELFGDEARPAAPLRRAERSATPGPPRPEPGDAPSRRAAVTGFDAPILLEAGAGTGKTATLVARVVHWCVGPGWEEAAPSDGEPEDVAVTVLRGVSAITFTEAAAAEMSTRVGQALACLQRVTATGEPHADDLPPGFLPEALPSAELLHTRARALRAALDHLNVSTIHAFCRRLLASHPLAVGFDPAFEVDATFQELEMVVRDTLEEHLRTAWSEPVDEDLMALAREGIGPPEIETAVHALAEAGARPAELLVDPLDEATCVRMRADLEASLDAQSEVAAPLEASTFDTRYAVVAIADTRAVVAALPADPREAIDALCGSVREIWEAEEGKPRKRLKAWAKGSLIKDDEKRLDEGQDEFVRRAQRLAVAIEPFFEFDPAHLERLRRVLGGLLGAVETELRHRGVATFSDLLVEARRLLRENPEIAARERRRMRQLLVDEFQDTDSVQCDVVAAIGLEGEPDERPGLFLVGDPKQSIFAWRNADLAAYHAFAGRVRDTGGAVHVLSCNFRSRRAILDEVAHAVAPVMEEVDGVQPPFAPLEPGREDADAPTDGPSIEYWSSWVEGDDGVIEPGVDKRKGASYDVEAAALARDVLERRRAEGLAWKDFAVVFRAFTDIETYLRELRERGIPYEVQSDRKYYQRREVVDATALVRAALDPHDHLALVTVLRSPMVGTPDAALLPLWEQGFPGSLSRLTRPDAERLGGIDAMIRAAVERVPDSIPGLGGIAGWDESLRAAIVALAEVRAAFREEPADRWIERLRATFLPDATEAARFLGAYRLANLERFFRDLLRALEDRAGDVQSILRSLRANLAREDRSEASRPADSGQDAVQILTIHGAKGLEFGHVYLAQGHKGDGGSRDDKTVFDRRGDHVSYRLLGSPAPNWFETKLRRDEATAAERVRLLYVALTRAKDRLVVLGGWATDPKRKTWRKAGTFAELLESRPHADAAVAELARRAANGSDEPYVDDLGALWRMAPHVGAGAEEETGGARSTPLLDPVAVAREVATLDAAREAAELRMGRPFSAAASDEAHADGAERRAGRRFVEGEAESTAAEHEPIGRETESTTGERTAPIGRAAAKAAGTAVHRVLELLELGPGSGAALEGWTARLDELVTDVEGEDRTAAVERACELCERLAANGLLERLVAIGDRVVARELPVLLPAESAVSDGGGTAPVGFVSGAIDLLYRDEDGALVVADYKTDLVETDEEIAERAATYAAQGRAYVAAVAEALGLDAEPRFELWFLRAGRVVGA